MATAGRFCRGLPFDGEIITSEAIPKIGPSSNLGTCFCLAVAQASAETEQDCRRVNKQAEMPDWETLSAHAALLQSKISAAILVGGTAAAVLVENNPL